MVNFNLAAAPIGHADSLDPDISKEESSSLPPMKFEPGVHVYPEGYTPPPAGSLSGNSSSLPFYLQPGFGFRAASYEPPSRITSPETTGRFPPAFTAEIPVFQTGSRELAEAEARCNRELLEEADKLEQEDEDGCDTEEAKVPFRAFKAKFAGVYRHLASSDYRPLLHVPPADTQEEHLTAEDMEDRLSGLQACSQAQHLATLALAHYNLINKTKFEMATVLLSKRFRETDGRTFAHVNFTASTQDQCATQPASKRLLFAELMYIPQIQSYDEGAEPLCVIHACTKDDSCFGGCHEMVRDIKKPLKDNLDYERCHACSDRIKHPRGDQFVAGHDSTRMPYYTVFM